MQVQYLILLADRHTMNGKTNLGQKSFGYKTQLNTTAYISNEKWTPRLLSRATSDSRLYRSAVFSCKLTTVISLRQVFKVKREYRNKQQIILTMGLITHLPFRHGIRSREI